MRHPRTTARGVARYGGAGSALFPLRIDSGERFFRTASGSPILPVVDTAWCAIPQMSIVEMDAYVSDLVSRKFNGTIVELVEHDFSTNAPGLKEDGSITPFTTANDFSTPRETYFARADYFIRACKAAGIIVFLWPVYTGAGAEGWDTIFESSPNTTAKRQAWGDFLAARYGSLGNVVWIHGGDSAVGSFTAYNEYVDRITSAVPGSLHSYHSTRTTRGRTTAGAQSWLKFDTIYTDNTDAESQTAAGVLASPAMPLLLVEEFYEGDTTAEGCLNAIWQAFCSGCLGGVAYGNAGIWSFPTGFASHYGDTARAAMQHLANLVAQFQWQKLSPVTNSSLVTTALGSGAAAICPMKATDSTFAFIYSPKVNFTLDRTAFAAAHSTIQIQSMNTATGAISSIAASDPTTGTRAITVTGSDQVIIVKGP